MKLEDARKQTPMQASMRRRPKKPQIPMTMVVMEIKDDTGADTAALLMEEGDGLSSTIKSAMLAEVQALLDWALVDAATNTRIDTLC